MSRPVLVATHKGLFRVERAAQSGRWEIAGVSFLGDNVNMLLPDRRDGTLYAALALGHFGVKLRRSRDGGATWEDCGVPVYPKAEETADGEAKSLAEIWSLEAGGPDQPGVLWAGTIPGGLFRSADRGQTWELVRSLWDRPERREWFGGGKDQPGIHSVCVDPRDSRHVSLGISSGGVWVTEDGGQTWACQADGMVAEYMPPQRQHDPNIQDVHRLVQCAAAPGVLWVQHHNGIFRSTDGARSWQRITDVRPSAFGFAVAVHPDDPETAWFVPAVKDECRVPAEGRVVVTRTRDGGRTFQALGDGLPQRHAYDLVYRHALDVDQTGHCLAIGSTTGALWISENAGDSWTTVSDHLPPVLAVRFG